MTTQQTQLQNTQQDAAQNGNNIEELTGEGNKTEKKLRDRARNAQKITQQPGEGKIEVL
mgnify:CR=1 FL=1